MMPIVLLETLYRDGLVLSMMPEYSGKAAYIKSWSRTLSMTNTNISWEIQTFVLKGTQTYELCG
ncbi:hypothetical protein DPMN_184812 [Dreissena polymorpha]|uniref:Uncharacterized protein n=1 Tax=Dreissena polymorpha TaxID=45954 RepID=A0A9D4DLK3_DREPO|nr:hypothetical protein DPMN_184812 [Dreissena polymorpha]